MNQTTIPAPTQGHTPEPCTKDRYFTDKHQIMFGDPNKYYADETDAEFIATCSVGSPATDHERIQAGYLAVVLNACSGLTAEQVVAIPRLIDSIHMTNIKAFEAMREALKEIADRFENLEDAYFEETRKWPPEYGTGDLVRARAALKLADDCEGETRRNHGC